MKSKLIITTVCLFFAISLSAQLKVNSNGSISQGYSGYANINLGNYTTTEGYTGPHWGIEVCGGNLNIWKPWPSPNNGEPNYYMFFTPSGAIGVGQVPTHQQEICLDVKGIVYSYGSALTSDERLKTDIKPLTDKFDKLYQLNGKSYKKQSVPDEITLPDIKDEKGNIIKKFEKKIRKSKEISEFGFLAQELMTVYPELVSKDTLGYYSVNYIGLIPVMVETLKNQKGMIDAQAIQINDLKVIVDKLGNASKK